MVDKRPVVAKRTHPECNDLVEEICGRQEVVEVEDLVPVRTVGRLAHARLLRLPAARDTRYRADVGAR